jgi:2-succinyl-5-enolpyruvyl-6-hydroxy-3-cyclohexene-1-carboxylate synthase
VISKQLKLFLRKNKDLVHWHIQPYGQVADTFQSLQRIIRTTPLQFFKAMHQVLLKQPDSFLKIWQTMDKTTASFITNFSAKDSFNEFEAVYALLKQIPGNSVLHLANSMAVRYANFIGLNKNVEVYANRGTSGIDGCLSTALGSAFKDERLHFIIIGDLAFFYDNNALWNNLPKSNLRILLINNKGGAIFGMIPGPSETKAYEEFFVTRQNRQAQQIAAVHGIGYKMVQNNLALEKVLPSFVDKNLNAPMILELISNEHTAVDTMQQFRTGLDKFLKNELDH